MRRNWTANELIVQWALLPEERILLSNKAGATRLGFTVLLKFFQFAGCFPRYAGEVPPSVVDHIAREVGVPAALWPEYRWKGSTIEYHRAQIRSLLGFREAAVADGVALTAWLNDQVGAQDRHLDCSKTALLEKYRAHKIEPPSPDRIERMVRSAVHTYDERLCETVSKRLPLEIHAQLKALLLPSRVAPEPEARFVPALLQELRSDAGPANLKTVQQELDKLDQVRALQLAAAFVCLGTAQSASGLSATRCRGGAI